MGMYNKANGRYSVAMGNQNTANGKASFAMGEQNTSNGDRSVAMGYKNTASTNYSVVMGNQNTANGEASVAMGERNTSNGNQSVAMGYTNTASTIYSVAMGHNNEITGNLSVAIGASNSVSGQYSVAMGYSNNVSGGAMEVCNVAIGYYLDTFDRNGFFCGQYNSDPGSGALFVVGKGDSSARSNIIVVNDTSLKCFGDITAFASSDYRLKTNLKKIETPLDKIKEINGYTFDWIENSEIHSYKGKDVGVIAQEVEEILPEVVTTRDNGYKGVKYEKLVPLLIECIKSQNKNIDNLENEVHSLKNELSSVNSELTNIKKHLGL